VSLRTGLSQQTSLRQELRVNPRLYQAMDMLYMPMMDLQQHLKQELLANPFLELLEPEDEEAPEQEAPKDQEKEKEQKEKEEEMDWEEILLNGFDVGGTREQFEVQEYTEPVTVETRNLTDHLREQLRMLELTPRQHLLAEEFLGNMTEDGYLAASLEELVGSVNQLVATHFAAARQEAGADAEAAAVEGEGTDAPSAAPTLPPGTEYTLAEAEDIQSKPIADAAIDLAAREARRDRFAHRRLQGAQLLGDPRLELEVAMVHGLQFDREASLVAILCRGREAGHARDHLGKGQSRPGPR